MPAINNVQPYFTAHLSMHPGEGSMDPWKQGLEAPQAAATELLGGGRAEGVYFVRT